jgi:hypothetical protein
MPALTRTAALVAACAASALAIAACGTTAKPLAGSPGVATAPGIHGKLDDPRTNVNNHVACLEAHHLAVTLVGLTDMRIGATPGGPYVHFTPAPGIAQGDQINGKPKYQGAEAIGSALLWPNAGTANVLQAVESCLAQGVSG